MSGSINDHHVGHIDILGVDKKGEEYYQFQLGGEAGAGATIGKIIGPAIPKEQVADTLEQLFTAYIAQRQPGERLIDTYQRIGMQPFKAAVYTEQEVA